MYYGYTHSLIKECLDDKDYGHPKSVESWSERISRGYGNCFHTVEEMKKLCENPCTVDEAYEHVKNWLEEKGIKEGEEFIVKIWW